MKIKINKVIETLFLVIFCFGYIGIIFDYGFPVFSILVVLSFLLFIIWNPLIYISIHYVPFLIFFIFYLIHFLISGMSYSITVGEFINGVSTIILLVTFSKVFHDKEQFDHFVSKFRNAIIFFAFIFSCIGLYKFFLFAISREIIPFFSHLSPLNTELIDDYNFYAAGLLIGLLVLKRKIVEQNKNAPQLYIFFIVISLAIVFSGSRRGVTILFAYFLYIIMKWFLSLFLDIVNSKLKISYIKIIVVFPISLLLGYLVFKNFGVAEIGEIKFFTSKIFDRLLSILSIKSDFGQSARGLIFSRTIEIIRNGNIFQIFFGSGFGYIHELGDMLNSTEQYPHSQILSHMAFGGLVGLILLLVIYIHSFIILITNYKEYKDILWSFLLLIFFCQFSGNTFLSFKTTLVFYIIILNLPKFNKFKKVSNI